MEKLKIKFVKMGCDIEGNTEGLNHRMRAIIPTFENEFVFIEIIQGERPKQQYTNITSKKEYFEKYPHQYYIFVDSCFRVDSPKDFYFNHTPKFRELTTTHFELAFTKENIIKLLQKLNKNIVDFELTDHYYLDELKEKMGFFRLYDERLQHKTEPLKILSMHGDMVRLKILYTAWNYNKSIEHTETWEHKINLAEIVTTPDGRQITTKERLIEQYGIDTFNILLEEYNKELADIIAQKPVILQCKNQYGYTIKQLKINYYYKTFQVGSFTIGADKTMTKKALNEKIEELKKEGFTEERGAQND